MQHALKTLVIAAACAPGVAEHARPRLICETAAAAPGMTVALALTFDIDEHWHLYWDGCNDSGFPVAVELELPEGWTAGEMQWPTPKRYVADGGEVLDHIYEKRVTFIIPVEAPATAQPGSTAEIRAQVDWLVCEDVCIPGSAALQMKLPVAASAGEVEASKDAPLFEEAREAQPMAWPEGPDATVSAEASGNVLTITSEKGTSVRFYPRRECEALVDRFDGAVSDDHRLALRFTSPNFEVDGIIEVVDARERRVGAYRLVWPISEAGTDRTVSKE